MPHLVLDFPYKARFEAHASDSVTLFLGARSARVSFATGDVKVCPASAPAEAPAPKLTAEQAAYAGQRSDVSNALSELAGFREELRETATGPFTTFTAPDGRETLVPGEVRRSFQDGERVVALMESPDQRVECVAFCVGQPVTHRLYAMPAVHGDDPLFARRLGNLAGEGELVACVVEDLLHLFRFVGTEVKVLSLQLPCAWGLPAVHAGKVRVLADTRLVVIDTARLAFRHLHETVPLSYSELTFPRETDQQPATVTVAIGNTLMLDHPRYGKVRAIVSSSDAPLQKGEQVLITDVREELPGIFRVYAVERVGAGHAISAPVSEREHHCPQPVLERYRGFIERTSDAQQLAALAARHAFRVPALLMKLLELHDGDPVFARWLRMLDLPFYLDNITANWEADPHLLAFLNDGGGDDWCLYVYPPFCSEGHEPPVVLHRHETREVEFCALTFEAFLEQHLAQRTDPEYMPEFTERDTPLVALVRERLGFPSQPRPSGGAPSWLAPVAQAETAAQGSGILKGPRAWFEGKAGLLARERALRTEFITQDSDADERPNTIRELREVCGRLGFSFALENLATLAINYPEAFDT